MTQAQKVEMINAAILRSSVAIRKGANVEIVDGKIVYTCVAQKSTGSYKKRLCYDEVLFMLQGEDMKAINKAIKA